MDIISMEDNAWKFLKLVASLTIKTIPVAHVIKVIILIGIMFVKKHTFCVWQVIKEEIVSAVTEIIDWPQKEDVFTMLKVVIIVQPKNRTLCALNLLVWSAYHVFQDATLIKEEHVKCLTQIVKSSTKRKRNATYAWTDTTYHQTAKNVENKEVIDCDYYFCEYK